ncbi:uncharacterized protein KY384_004856 [Bacidia gigantensis]|uniref:uncharacterized protein n=1 Tax=Bacidia gigantensis TaxID=2732470 RepID=UPI001D04BD6B|nr:uncharacterized protein KY384_004856 [Bacidia gigantensis]KAG8530354.1 hypothetical protein KY384_004856 [Bacidia gigantensis]
MREVNFSIPNVNKASVGITTALYDRRALDCTSTLPLINSLNHLAYLTTSSARIRDILTIDGGVERLVCILKQGRSQEMMEMWKWNLAFQCVVNIGVRGSESVRTRVVEADMVPVIATILYNYIKSLPAAVPSMDAGGGLPLRPVRDADRLPSMLPPLQTGQVGQTGITSQPDSPTTPSAPSIESILQPTRSRRRPSVRQQSHSGDSDDTNADEAASEVSAANDNSDEPMIDIQTSVDIQEGEDQDAMLDDVSVADTLQNVSDGRETETFNITHQSANDGSIINANVTPTNQNIGFPPPTQPMVVVNMAAQAMPQNSHARYLLDRSAPPGILAATPRDEDVLMSLQLLAYVSKYCNLRSYFHNSHLVPKLRLKDEVLESQNSDDASPPCNDDKDEDSDDSDEEYLLPDDFTIFPLVEKFTVRHHSQDMQHWAGVVMRNLCRKDDARGGIRQCAFYECVRQIFAIICFQPHKLYPNILIYQNYEYLLALKIAASNGLAPAN